MRHSPPILLLAALAACTDLSPSPFGTPTPPPAFRLSSGDAWSGGQVRIISAHPLPDTLPVVTVGGHAVAATRLNDSTLVLTLPIAIGAQPVVVTAGPTKWDAGTLTVHGFDMMGTQFGLWGVLTQLPGVPAVVIGNGTTSLATADLHTGSVTTYADSIHSSNCSWGPGVTSQAGRFIFAAPDTGAAPCPHSRWEFTPSLTRLESTPSFTQVESDNHRVIAELAPGRWLVSEKYDFTLWVCDTGCVNTSEGNLPNAPDVPGRLDGVHLSPRGDRVAVDEYFNAGTTGIPVIDAATATVAYWEPSLAWSEGAAFSPHGDTLFIAGGDSAVGGQTWMFVLRASDGAVLDSVPLAVRPGDLALDPGGRWIYVSGQYSSYHVSYATIAARLEVLDRTTLQPATVLLSDSINVAGSGYANKHRLVLDPGSDQAFIVTTDLFDVPDLPPTTDPTAMVFRFSIPP
jgi:hypothetical protein